MTNLFCIKTHCFYDICQLLNSWHFFFFSESAFVWLLYNWWNIACTYLLCSKLYAQIILIIFTDGCTWNVMSIIQQASYFEWDSCPPGNLEKLNSVAVSFGWYFQLLSQNSAEDKWMREFYITFTPACAKQPTCVEW